MKLLLSVIALLLQCSIGFSARECQFRLGISDIGIVNKARDAVCSRLVEGALEELPDSVDKKIPAKPKLAGKSFLKRRRRRRTDSHVARSLRACWPAYAPGRGPEKLRTETVVALQKR
jgi:hypothetical protein